MSVMVVLSNRDLMGFNGIEWENHRKIHGPMEAYHWDLGLTMSTSPQSENHFERWFLNSPFPVMAGLLLLYAHEFDYLMGIRMRMGSDVISWDLSMILQ